MTPTAIPLVQAYGVIVREFKFDARVSFQVITLSWKEMNGFVNSFNMEGKEWGADTPDYISKRACALIKRTIKGTYTNDKPWWSDPDCARDYNIRYQGGESIDSSGEVHLRPRRRGRSRTPKRGHTSENKKTITFG